MWILICWRIFYGSSTSAANKIDKAGLIVSFNLPVNSNLQYTVVTVLWINPNFKLDHFLKVLTKWFKTTSTGEWVLLRLNTARSESVDRVLWCIYLYQRFGVYSMNITGSRQKLPVTWVNAARWVSCCPAPTQALVLAWQLLITINGLRQKVITIPYKIHTYSHLFRTAGTLWNASYQDWLALRCVDTRLKSTDHSSSNDDFCLGLFPFIFFRTEPTFTFLLCLYSKEYSAKAFHPAKAVFFLLEGFFLLYLISTSTKELAASSFVQNV